MVNNTFINFIYLNAAFATITLALIFPSVALATQSVGCFSSGKINVKFVQISQDGLDMAYVKYQKSKQAIPLLFIKETEEKFPEGRPSAFTTEWDEVLKSKINGRYTVMTQGARYYQFDYKSSTGRVVRFTENLNAYDSIRHDCQW